LKISKKQKLFKKGIKMDVKKCIDKLKALNHKTGYEVTFTGDCNNADDFNIIELYDKKIIIIDFGV